MNNLPKNLVKPRSAGPDRFARFIARFPDLQPKTCIPLVPLEVDVWETFTDDNNIGFLCLWHHPPSTFWDLRERRLEETIETSKRQAKANCQVVRPWNFVFFQKAQESHMGSVPVLYAQALPLIGTWSWQFSLHAAPSTCSSSLLLSIPAVFLLQLYRSGTHQTLPTPTTVLTPVSC